MLGRSARKRLTILAAGHHLFLSNGYQGTSVDQIAASAEVSKQTVYKHFGDKHELLLAIVDNALEGSGWHRATLRLSFPDAQARLLAQGVVEATCGGIHFEPGPSLTLEGYRYSPGYGEHKPAARLLATWTGKLPIKFRWSVQW